MPKKYDLFTSFYQKREANAKLSSQPSILIVEEALYYAQYNLKIYVEVSGTPSPALYVSEYMKCNI